MWGKRQKRLPKRVVLGLLAEAMEQAEQAERAEQQQEREPEAIPYPEEAPAPVAPPGPTGLRAADVPVDNSAGPEPLTSGEDHDPLLQREVPAPRTGESTRHGTFG
jgi:hypothetical protein